MKLKIILFFLAAVICALVIFGQRKSGPGPVTLSESSGREAPVFVPPSVSSSSRTVQRSRLDLPAPLPEPDLTELLAEFHRAVLSTNLTAREFALTNLLATLILKDAPAAAHVAGMIVDPDLREEVLRRVAQLWAAQDSSGALAWAAGLADATEREAVRADICLKVAEVNPAEAIQIYERFGPDETGGQVLENLAHQWAEKDFPAALAWTLARLPGEQRDNLVGRLAFVQSQTSPVEAARLVLDQIPPGGAQEEAVISVLHQLALRDLAAATSWVEQFPESWLRQRAQLELSSIGAAAPWAPFE